MRKSTSRQGNSQPDAVQEGAVQGWTLVWRLHRGTLASRRRGEASYPSVDAAYTALRTLQRQARGQREYLSAAHLASPQGRKIPLVSDAPPHLLIEHERLTHLVQPRPAQPLAVPAMSPPDLRAARAILHRRLGSTFTHAAEISRTTATVIACLRNALLTQTDEVLADICATRLAPPAAEPPPLPPPHERLFRRLQSLSAHAQAVAPATARLLAILAHAFAQGTDAVVLQACRTYLDRYGATPLDPRGLYDNLPLECRARHGSASAPMGQG